MRSPHDQHQKRQHVFMSSIGAIANILAFITAFLLTPEINARTVRWVITYTESRYGTGEFSDFVSLIWFATVALLTFFTARATLATAIVAAGVAAATRFI